MELSYTTKKGNKLTITEDGVKLAGDHKLGLGSATHLLHPNTSWEDVQKIIGMMEYMADKE